MAPARLAPLLAKLKQRGMKIVFTNGCFDIIHVGHVSYLERAKSCGDVLVVALNSDSSVKKLGKGPNRPVNTLSDRAIVISALESVDFVTSFDENTPLKLIQKFSPDVLVKGGDWKPAQIVGSDFVVKNGGKVKSLPFVKGKSTTKIIERIIKTT